MSDAPNTTGGPATHPQSSFFGRMWMLLRILNVRLRFIFLMVAVGLVVGYWENITNRYDRWRRPAQTPETAKAGEKIEYFCPMHPNVIRAAMGNCPICGMPLSKRAKTGPRALPEGVLAEVQLTPQKMLLGRVATSPVEYRLLGREIRAVGIVEPDETRRAFLASRIKGRIEKLMVNYVGQHVERGDPLVSVYSPDLLVAQQELLNAARAVEEQKVRGNEIVLKTNQALLESARRKLLLWGVTPEQVEQIVRDGAPQTSLTIYSPMAGIVIEKKILEGRYVNEGDDLYTIADLRRVWMQAKIFEDEIGQVKVGTAVEVTSAAYPDKIFAGRITFVAYTVEPGTRTVAARVEIDNADYLLKPGMYASAVTRTPVGEVSEIVAAPASAPVAASSPATTALNELTRAYLAVADAYSLDKSDAGAVSALIQKTKGFAEQAGDARRATAAELVKHAEQLPGKDLAGQREVFQALSARLIELLRADPPPGMKFYVAHCPMVPADWVQTSPDVANPYYGSSMFRCGDITGEIEAAGAVDAARYVAGYYCPLHPNQLMEGPRECPVDQSPMKRVKIEKTLSVPESAVVNTGARQIVYRESAPGTFEMIEVKLGNRAGEFYPVLGGLKPEDRVVTVGAFVVDAENRLNPAAAAQYFGATGNP